MEELREEREGGTWGEVCRFGDLEDPNSWQTGTQEEARAWAEANASETPE